VTKWQHIMKLGWMTGFKASGAAVVLAGAATILSAAEVPTNSSPASPGTAVPRSNSFLNAFFESQPTNWNFHVQNTDIVQGYPGFHSQYSGPDSLPSGGQTRETVSVDLMAGLRLWPGAEAHADGFMWQGFGIGDSKGIAGFPNGEAFQLGTSVPGVNFVRTFIRQTIGFGGSRESVQDDDFDLAGDKDISRLTITIGRFSAKDIFDNNAYANDPRTQFMNWGLIGNEAWDFPADALGYMTGLALELNQPRWTERYGFFQMPRVGSGTALDMHVLQAWGMVAELERRYTIAEHPGTIRFLAYLNHAHMGSYLEAIDDSPPGAADVVATRAYRYKYGFGLNWEQEIAKDVGIFSRLGWSDGHTESWCFSDVDDAVSAGLSVNGDLWHRPNDTFGLAGVFSGISKVHQEFFEDGGTGILAGDGNLNYGWEKIIETYYDFKIYGNVHGAADYQFITNPAFNRDRGPVSVFGGRLHWEF
jgi:high affinity Mn2+ porin